MSRYLMILLAAVLAVGLVACGDDEEDAATSDPGQPGQATQAAGSDAISVIATTSQIGALAQEIGGDQINLLILMPAGVDPHSYEITPDDMRAVGDADLILKNGIGLDDFLDDNIEAAGGDADIVVVTEGIDLVEGGHHEDDHDEAEDDHDHDEEHEEEHDDEHDHGEFDPHVWHDPANAIVMVENIVAALAAADGGNAAAYEENGDAYRAVLEETDVEIRAMLDQIPAEHRKLVTTHDAFGYFVHAYDFEFIGAVVPSVSTDAEPSARDIADLLELIQDEDVRAIFAEDTVDPRVAEQLAQDSGVEIVYGLHSDSLGEPGSGEDTIHGMLLANATKIAEALK